MPHATYSHTYLYTHAHTHNTSHVINRITNQYKCHSSVDIWDLWPVCLALRIRTVVPPPFFLSLTQDKTTAHCCWPLSINWRVNLLNLKITTRKQKIHTKKYGIKKNSKCRLELGMGRMDIISIHFRGKYSKLTFFTFV